MENQEQDGKRTYKPRPPCSSSFRLPIRQEIAQGEHAKWLKQGVDFWNKWRSQQQNVQPDLRRADLRGANLRGANLRGAILSMANLSGANLTGVNPYLSGANLTGVNPYLSDEDEEDGSDLLTRSFGYLNTDLSRADLSGVNLEDANLSGVNLSRASLSGVNLSRASLLGADLIGADLSGANLSSVDLSYARTSGTTFANLDLRTVKGLTHIQHYGPSHIELYSVQFPSDGTAQHFLRGAGVPDEWIDFLQSKMMHPIQYHSLFISYSSKDKEAARRLYRDLQTARVRCWFALEDLKIGNEFRQSINKAIHLQDKLLLLLSEHSIRSDWVADEVEAAFEKEQRQQREVLFPIRLDDAVMQASQAWAAKLRRTRHIGDFTNWTEPQAYLSAFDRLLRDLQKGDDGEPSP